MNHDEIENLLRRMPLSPPSDSLDARVLAAAPRRRRGLRVAVVLAASTAAAAVAAMVLMWLGSAGPTAPAPRPQRDEVIASLPVAPQTPSEPTFLQAEWSNVVYQGIVTDSEGVPYRRYHKQTVYRAVLDDQAQDRTVMVEVPDEEVILVGVETY